MKILAVDTALAACSAAVYDSDDDRMLASIFQPMTVGHAEAIAPAVRQIMLEAGIEFSSLDRIATTIGPGTFTGLRIGLSFAKALGLALDLPVVGLSTLKAIAANIASNPHHLPIVAAIDARRGNVYAQLFTHDLAPLSEACVCAAPDVSKGLADGDYLVVGSASDLLITLPSNRRLAFRKADAPDLPSATIIAKLARLEPATGTGLEPLYLRAPDAKPPHAAPLQFLQIGGADRADAQALATLHAQCFVRPWSADSFSELLEIPGTIAVLAKVNDAIPVGLAIARCAADEAEFLTLAVHPDYRRRHIGERLVMATAAGLAKMGSRHVYMEVAATNAGARRLYEKLGFVSVATRQNYYPKPDGDHEDALLMKRSLPIAPPHV
jgi:tRNA threonylcarbamoyl adenosine modification protein YeaZ/ribosomal-protein-alanine acetyltransferase